MTARVWGYGSPTVPATNIVPVRQPVLAIGQTHADPPHRDSPATIRQIGIGQTAAVSPSPGVTFPAKVTAVGILPSDATTSGTSYPVAVTVASATVKKNAEALSAGVAATVKITTASATDAVLVPVSAVTPTGTARAR